MYSTVVFFFHTLSHDSIEGLQRRMSWVHSLEARERQPAETSDNHDLFFLNPAASGCIYGLDTTRQFLQMRHGADKTLLYAW